jgi:hypothetical protein
VTPAQEAKAEVYKELGYQVAGMVGVNLTVARPMVKARGTWSRSLGRTARLTKTLTRYKSVAVYCRRSPVEINSTLSDQNTCIRSCG